MYKAFLAVILVVVISGCSIPSGPILLESTTWMITFKYTSSDPSGLRQSTKIAERHCKEFGKSAHLEIVTSVNEYTSYAKFLCE